MRLKPIAALATYFVATTISPSQMNIDDMRWFVDGHKIEPELQEPEVRLGGLIQPSRHRVLKLLRSVEDL